MSARLTVARPAASQGVAWIKTGWSWFKQAPVPWMGMAAMALLALTAIAMLPRVGGIIVEILSPFMIAGFMSAGRAAERGEPVTFLHLAAGFQSQARTQLAIIGVAYLAGILLIDTVMRQIGGEGFQQMAQLAQNPQQATPEQVQAIMAQVLPAMLVGLLLMIPLVMATWFSPVLALFDGYSAGNALWWSIWASAVNWRPALVYSLWFSLIGLVTILIPFGLGLLLFLPLTMTSSYAAYRDIFVPIEQPPTSLA
jgi:hypothetical protein